MQDLPPKFLYDQACRQRWRALFFAIKAKMEAVECGISTFKEEFLPHFVVPGMGGRTVGMLMIPELNASYSSGKALPNLLQIQ